MCRLNVPPFSAVWSSVRHQPGACRRQTQVLKTLVRKGFSRDRCKEQGGSGRRREVKKGAARGHAQENAGGQAGMKAGRQACKRVGRQRQKNATVRRRGALVELQGVKSRTHVGRIVAVHGGSFSCRALVLS